MIPRKYKNHKKIFKAYKTGAAKINKYVINYNCSPCNPFQNDNLIFMDHVGVDSGGKDVFELDIIQTYLASFGKKFIGVIYYDEYTSGYKVFYVHEKENENENGVMDYFLKLQYSTVIGSIFEEKFNYIYKLVQNILGLKQWGEQKTELMK